jgi:hypothetical protein
MGNYELFIKNHGNKKTKYNLRCEYVFGKAFSTSYEVKSFRYSF